MDPRTALLQQESDDNGKGFRNKSIGMHNLRAKLREQLKGYSHVRAFPLEPESKVGNEVDRRTDSLTARRDSIRRRHSSVTRQGRYDAEADAEDSKYRPRRSQKKESLLVPRLLWFTVYLSLCFMAYKGMTYFTGEKHVKLCQSCSGGCGVLDEEFTVPVDSLGDLPFGTVFPQQSSLQCRSDVCVPGHVADPKALCRVVADEALLYHTRRLLAAEDDSELSNERFLEYFRRRALREEGLAGALSPTGQPTDTPKQTATAPTPTATKPADTPSPAATPPTGTKAPAPGPKPDSGLLSSGAFYHNPNIVWASLSSYPASAYSTPGDCQTLTYAPTEGNGYANLTTEYYKGITEVEHYGQCCGLCAYESQCVGWTRVAGGDPSVRSCYLRSTMDMDPSDNAMTYNWQPTKAQQWPPNPEVRYSGGVPIMFESGTKGTPLPSIMYGCPYPPSADGKCNVPNGCNCGGGACYGSCIAPNVKSTSPQT